MKSQFFSLLAVVASSFVLTGCFTGIEEDPGDPKALLEPIRKGEKVIVRVALDVTPAKNKVTHGRIMQLLSPYTDDANIKYSITSITLEPGQYTVLHTLTVPETFYILEGNGILKISEKDYVLRPGKLVYVPGNKKQTVINNGKKVLKFLSLISPAYKPKFETDLKKLKPVKKKADANKDGLFTGKYSDKPVNMQKDKGVKIQTLSTKEGKSGDTK